jgi:hypothetical protein
MTAPVIVASADVAKFANLCVSARSTWTHYQTLFEASPLRRELLNEIAPVFFGDLNQMLIEHLVLQVCKITDPAQTSGRSNLTVKYLVQHGTYPPADLVSLTELSNSMEQFRAKVVPARNRIISHVDLEAVQEGVPLGGAATSEWDQFWQDLESFVQLVHRHYVDAAWDFRITEVGMLSDSDGLVKALRESTYFQNIVADHTLTQRAADIAFASKFAEA